MRMTDELQIDAPVEVVWGLTADVEAWPTVTPTMTTIEKLSDGPIGLGSSARVKQPAQRAAVWTVSAFEPDRLFEWTTSVWGVRMTGRHELTSTDGGTQNVLVLDVTGPGSWLLSKLVGRKMRESIATENRGFKAHAERVAAQR
jgi:uncharacterized membrane protein